MRDKELAKNIPEIFEAAIADFRYLPVKERETKAIALAAVRKDPKNLFFTTKMADDRDVVTAAVTRDGKEIRHASNRLKNDKTIAMAAVRQTGKAFEFLPARFRKDDRMLKEALRTDPYAILYAFTHQKHNRDLLYLAVKGDPEVLWDLWEDFGVGAWDFDHESDSPWTLDDSGEVVCRDRKIMMEVVKRCGSLLRVASDDLRIDPEIRAAAVKNDPDIVDLVWF